MRYSINLIRAYAHARVLIFWMIAVLVVIHLRASIAQDTLHRTPPMEDAIALWTKYSQLPEYARIKLTELDLHTKYNTWDMPAPFAKLRDKWAKIIGPNWGYFHHYSRGIFYLQKANSIEPPSYKVGNYKDPETERIFNLNQALDEFIFCENSTMDHSSFQFWPQLFVMEYQIYSQLGKPDLALKALKQAQKYRRAPNPARSPSE